MKYTSSLKENNRKKKIKIRLIIIILALLIFFFKNFLFRFSDSSYKININKISNEKGINNNFSFKIIYSNNRIEDYNYVYNNKLIIKSDNNYIEGINFIDDFSNIEAEFYKKYQDLLNKKIILAKQKDLQLSKNEYNSELNQVKKEEEIKEEKDKVIQKSLEKEEEIKKISKNKEDKKEINKEDLDSEEDKKEINKEDLDSEEDIIQINKEAKKAQRYKAQLFYIKIEKEKTILSPLEITLKENEDKEDNIFKVLLSLINGKNLESNGDYMTAIPDLALNRIAFINDVALVDISEDIAINNLGNEGIKFSLAQIIYTLTQFESISSVQFLIDGKKIDFLTEFIKIDRPLNRDFI